jgi:hypothetical protein
MARKPVPLPKGAPEAPSARPPVNIDREAIDILFGGNEGLDAAIKAYTLALKGHAKSVNIPAPTTHPWVEKIVREHASQYIVIEPETPPPPPEPDPVKEAEIPPDPTLAEIKEKARRVLSDLRHRKVREGVTYKGYSFWGDPMSAYAIGTALMAIEDEGNVLVRWKAKRGEFAELERVDLKVLLKLIHKRTQMCFDTERAITQAIRAASTVEEIEAIDFSAGWPA